MRVRVCVCRSSNWFQWTSLPTRLFISVDKPSVCLDHGVLFFKEGGMVSVGGGGGVGFSLGMNTHTHREGSLNKQKLICNPQPEIRIQRYE